MTVAVHGVLAVAREAAETAAAIQHLRDSHSQRIIHGPSKGPAAHELLKYLFEQPITTIRHVAARLECSYVTASRLVNRFVDLVILQETTGKQRHRLFRYDSYLALFESKKQEAGA